MDKSIEDRASFELIRYANCWEDADILCEALQPAPGKRFLSIASAGDNSFSLLAGGAEVVAADLSTAQLSCVELRRSAFAKLEYEPLLEFFGVRPSPYRSETYRSLAQSLPEFAKNYWDQNLSIVECGFIHAGKFENYFKTFRTRIIPLIHSKQRIAELLLPKTLEDRTKFYYSKWCSVRWRLLFKIFFSRFVMGRLGRDPEFFRYVQGSVSQRILDRTNHALTEIPTHDNPYLRYILTGNYADEALPHYLRPENFDAIREGLDRLTLFQGPIQEAAKQYGQSGFDGFNLSDIFEYLDDGLCHQIYSRLIEVSRPAARFAYWNMLVPRAVSDELANQAKSLDDFAEELFLRDKAWFYSRFVVEELK